MYQISITPQQKRKRICTPNDPKLDCCKIIHHLSHHNLSLCQVTSCLHSLCSNYYSMSSWGEDDQVILRQPRWNLVALRWPRWNRLGVWELSTNQKHIGHRIRPFSLHSGQRVIWLCCILIFLQLPLQSGQGTNRIPPQPSQQAVGCGCGAKLMRSSPNKPSSWRGSTCSNPPM